MLWRVKIFVRDSIGAPNLSVTSTFSYTWNDRNWVNNRLQLRVHTGCYPIADSEHRALDASLNTETWLF